MGASGGSCRLGERREEIEKREIEREVGILRRAETGGLEIKRRERCRWREGMEDGKQRREVRGKGWTVKNGGRKRGEREREMDGKTRDLTVKSDQPKSKILTSQRPKEDQARWRSEGK